MRLLHDAPIAFHCGKKSVHIKIIAVLYGREAAFVHEARELS